MQELLSKSSAYGLPTPHDELGAQQTHTAMNSHQQGSL